MANKKKPKCTTCNDSKLITVRTRPPAYTNDLDVMWASFTTEQRHCTDCCMKSFIVVHGHKNFDLCGKARVAFEASEEVATQIRKHPECMACGGTLEVYERPRA